SVTFDNSLDGASRTITLNASGFIDGQTHPFSTIETAIIWTGPGGGTANLDYISVPTSVSGGSGNDVVNVGNGNLDTNLLASVTVNGNSGTDALFINDAGDVGDDNYSFGTSDTMQKSTSSNKVVATGMENTTLDANKGNNMITVNSIAVPL